MDFVLLAKLPRKKRAKVVDGVASIGYARVSTAEQSLELQTKALERYGCEYILTEKISAVSSKRVKLEQALINLRDGDKFVVWKLDRLARSLPDLLRRVEQIENAGATLVSLTETIDTSTAIGKMLLAVIGAIAQFERDLIAERTSAGMRAAREAGKRMGAPPALTPAKIKQAQKLRKQGKTLRYIAGKVGCSASTVRNYTVGPSRSRKR